jgi:DNA-directed RNA polymerase specialized sigma24 family protein
VTSGFDEWVAARTPSLLRFAHLLAGTDDDAERAVRTALARIWSSWDQTLRADDPDLRARALVVQACPSRRPSRVRASVPVAVGAGPAESVADVPAIGSWLEAMPVRRRAAVVLRLLEERSDLEIADVLGVSESSVRAQLHRAFEALPPELPTSPDARDGVLRGALAAYAASAPAQLRGVTPVDAPPSRRRGAGVAAVAVLVLVAGVAWVTHETRTPAGVITYPAVTAPTSWRVESYDGVQVRVPSTWGWGGAPVRADYFRGDKLGACGANQAAVNPDGARSSYVSSATAFAGRPAVMTDLCMSWGSDGVMPSTDALWFGSPLPVGVKGLGSVVAETRAVGGQHVTVFSADSHLRREILGTAEAVDTDANGCPTVAVQQPSPGPARLDPTSLSVCVYSQDTGVPVLQWSGREDAAAARRYVDAFGRSATDPAKPCVQTPNGQWVALGVSGGGGGDETRWDVVNLDCSRIVGADQAEAPLLPATLDPWAHNAIRAYVSGPRSPTREIAAYFRGALG